MELEVYDHLDLESYYCLGLRKLIQSYTGRSKIVYDISNRGNFEQIVDEFYANQEDKYNDFYESYDKDNINLNQDIINSYKKNFDLNGKFEQQTFNIKTINYNINSIIKLSLKYSKTTNDSNIINNKKYINNYFYLTELFDYLIKIFSLSFLKSFYLIDKFFFDLFNAGKNGLFPKRKFIKVIFLLEIDKMKLNKIYYFIIIYGEVVINEKNEKKYFIKIYLD